MPYFPSHDDTRLFFTDWGDRAAPPVLFAHAWGLDSGMWGAQVAALVDAGYRCVTYDRRGHGRSDVPGHGYDLDTLADDLGALVAHLDLSDVLLVAHSMGTAEVVRHLARHGTGHARGVLLSGAVTPMAVRTDDNPHGVDEAVFAAARDAMRADIGAWVDATSSREYFGTNRDVSASLTEWARRRIVDTPLHVLVTTQREFTRADQRAELAALSLPMLVLHGTADTSAPLELTGRPTAALAPGARLVALDGAGHGLYISESMRYNAELLAFARETAAVARR
ncbi:MAG TPA: alpha/beta hydrolase [Pseudonocardiaceae bacterium]|nr:alpha/beta hydrolase [Pseudonocardiaceae bacterium]